jgi:MSHA pilin protein MshD
MWRQTEGRAKDARRAQRGASLLELIMFIVVVGAGLAGIIGIWQTTAQGSADPLIQKQALAIAEAYLEETLAMPFTYCDPDDVHAAMAESDGPVNPADTTRCAVTLEAIGAEGGEARGSGTTPYDNVNDYNSLAAAAPASIDGDVIAGLDAYQVSVAVTGQSLTAGALTVPAAASLRVTVTVTGPGNTTVTLDGYRTRYAPNALP